MSTKYQFGEIEKNAEEAVINQKGRGMTKDGED